MILARIPTERGNMEIHSPDENGKILLSTWDNNSCSNIGVMINAERLPKMIDALSSAFKMSKEK